MNQVIVQLEESVRAGQQRLETLRRLHAKLAAGVGGAAFLRVTYVEGHVIRAWGNPWYYTRTGAGTQIYAAGTWDRMLAALMQSGTPVKVEVFYDNDAEVFDLK